MPLLQSIIFCTEYYFTFGRFCTYIFDFMFLWDTQHFFRTRIHVTFSLAKKVKQIFYQSSNKMQKAYRKTSGVELKRLFVTILLPVTISYCYHFVSFRDKQQTIVIVRRHIQWKKMFLRQDTT